MKYYYKIVTIVKGMNKKNMEKRWKRGQERRRGVRQRLCNQRFFYALCAHHI